MPWTIAHTGEVYTGAKHQLGANTFTGKTRTPDSKRLVWAEEVEAARNDKGHFVADDTSTPDIDESKKKRAPRKKK